MTPNILHRQSKKIEPYIKTLFIVLGTSILIEIPLWMLAFGTEDGYLGGGFFYIIAVPHMSLFWSFGLLLLYFMFKRLPSREHMILPVYLWNALLVWPASIFISFWFLALSIFTLVIPILGATYVYSLIS